MTESVTVRDCYHGADRLARIQDALERENLLALDQLIRLCTDKPLDHRIIAEGMP